MPAGAERDGPGPRARRNSAPLRAPQGPTPPRTHPPDRPVLRLALSRGALAIELEEPFVLGPLSVTSLGIRLPDVRFPVDLSGGVTRFRHRRGALLRLGVEARMPELVAWLAPRLVGVIGVGTPEVVVAPTDAGFLVGVRSGDAALAFDLVVAPIERDVRLLPERARAIGLREVPHVLALRALAAASGGLGREAGRLHGGAVVVPDAVGALTRRLLPLAGARVPDGAGVRWDAAELGPSSLALLATSETAPPALADRALRALELADLTSRADELAFAGDLEGARREYLTLLERAPRHPEISRRLAWIDLAAGDRAEAALSTLVEALPAIDAGTLGGELLAAVGDGEGARAALSRGAASEPYGPLAALAWLRVGALATGLDERLHALDEAVTRAPAMDRPRWARLGARLDLGDAGGAKADAEHLEAAARGPEARHRVWRLAADAFLERGFVAEAGALFERALRYAPDSPEAVAGLGRSLQAAGQGRRSLDLYARAALLAERRGERAHAVSLLLARGLAEIAGDRPAAIARVRAIPAGTEERFEALFFEGKWRAELGDLAGATLAFGRLADGVEFAMGGRDSGSAGRPLGEADRDAALAALLVQAASIEEELREDVLAARRCLGLALRLRPRDRAIGAAFRRVAGLANAREPSTPRIERTTDIGGLAPAAPPPATLHEGAPSATQPIVSPAPVVPAVAPGAAVAPVFADAPSLVDEEGEPPVDEPDARAAEDDERAQRLTDRLRADPRDAAAVLELADVLTRLGRDLELLALLSARIEEGDERERQQLMPRRREVLARLATRAREEGRPGEAELYEMMLDAEA